MLYRLGKRRARGDVSYNFKLLLSELLDSFAARSRAALMEIALFRALAVVLCFAVVMSVQYERLAGWRKVFNNRLLGRAGGSVRLSLAGRHIFLAESLQTVQTFVSFERGRMAIYFGQGTREEIFCLGNFHKISVALVVA